MRTGEISIVIACSLDNIPLDSRFVPLRLMRI